MFTAGDLSAFGFTDDLIDRIMTFLDTSATDLGVSKPDDVAHTSFGSSPASLACATDAGKARTHVASAIDDMVTGLHLYQLSLGTMQSQANEVQDAVVTDLQQYTARAEACTATPTVGTPSQCEATA